MIKKSSKKFISSLIALALVISALAVGILAYGDDLVAINATNFPDKNFRTVVSDFCDENEDGYLSSSEIAVITAFDVSGYLDDIIEGATITDLTGIERFTSLRRLYCYGLDIEELDTSKLTNLSYLNCDGCQITSLDLSKNTALTTLYCEGNELTALDLSNNTALTTLFCNANNIESIDVSMLSSLRVLHVEDNELSTLNVRNNTNLEVLFCAYNHIAELDLSNNAVLSEATDSRIGNQVVTSTATAYRSTIFVPLAIASPSNIFSTSLDTYDEIDGITVPVPGYQDGSFFTTEINDIKNGIDYYYNTGLATAENMSVHVDVERDFYLVRFYTSSSLTTLIGSDVVSINGDAAAPEISDAPQCREFGGWSEDITNVTGDLDVYIVWREAHSKYISEFDDNTVYVECENGCGEHWAYDFSRLTGRTTTDSDYVEIVDVNSDGVINGRDLVYLKTGNF